MSITNSLDEATAATQDLFAQVSLEDVSSNDEPPYIDINRLAFADENGIRNAQKQYAEDLYK